jgi:hypothetical protein
LIVDGIELRWLTMAPQGHDEFEHLPEQLLLNPRGGELANYRR